MKDPIVQRVNGAWQAWICCHPLDEPDEEDRMWSAYATSPDGVDWQLGEIVLRPRARRWDARGARLTAVLPDGRATYDGRATKEENWFERTGLAKRRRDRTFEQVGDEPVSVARYSAPSSRGGLLFPRPLSRSCSERSKTAVPEPRTLEEDRRRQPLALTEQGSSALHSAQTSLRERLAALLADMPPHEADALARLLELLQASLSGTPPPPRPHRPRPPRPGHGLKHRKHP